MFFVPGKVYDVALVRREGCTHDLIRLTSFRQRPQQRFMKGLRCFDLGRVAKFGEFDEPGIWNHFYRAARELRIVPKSRRDFGGSSVGARRSTVGIADQE